MQHSHICQLCRKNTIIAQSKSSKSFEISILCNLIKVLQLLYMGHLSMLTGKVPDI